MTATYRETGLAIILAVLLSIPSLLIGGLFSFVYKLFLQYVLITLFWLPFYEIIQTVSLGFFGGMLHGGITAAGAIGGAGAIFRESNLQIVAYSTSAVLITLTIIAIALNVSIAGFSLGLFEASAFVFGLLIGTTLVRRQP